MINKIKNNSQLNSGFTLIELLVVIAIISMVIAVLFPNFMGARERARDTERKGDLSNIQKALELYKLNDQYQRYPTTGAFPASICGQCWSSSSNCSGNIYLRKVPCDPGSLTGTPYIYNPGSTSQYALSACLENAVDPDKDLTPVSPCNTSTGNSYTIHEP
ncbi:type II secretion system GspH family protein [Patescibacteria group bacterium]|nr:type II secretion system GspH family protein [Patescibacteria group bacterium]MCL5797504.1 type II secretion system GspH family protein [Patescibacteria group bacterium]